MMRPKIIGLLVALAVLAGLGETVETQVLRGRYSVPTTGYIDPTVPTFNGGKPLTHCSGGCTSLIVNQNTDALQAALDQAGTGGGSPLHAWIHLPPGEYPIARGKNNSTGAYSQIYGVQVNGKSKIVVVGYGATIRETGAITGTYEMIQVQNSSDIRWIGVTMSQRDDSTSPPAEQNHMIQLGSGTNTGYVDNVQIVDSRFVEGKGGDPIRFLGGSNLSNLVTRVAVHANLINGKRTALSFQHGTAMINAIGNMMGPDCTDQLIDHEPTSPGGNNFFNAIGNHLSRQPGVNAPLVTFGGDSGGDALFQTATSNVFAYNDVPNGEFEGLDMYQTWVVGNNLRSQAGISKPVVYVNGLATDMWVDDNTLSLDGVADSTTQLILLENNGGDRTTNIWIDDNHLDWYDSAGSFMDLRARDAFVVGNKLVQHNAATTINGILLRSVGKDDRNVDLLTSGIIADNDVSSAVGAGAVAIAYSCGTDGTDHDSGFCRVRNNFARGLATFFQATQVNLLEGPPLVSGNVLLSVTTTGLNTPKWVTETTDVFDVVTSTDPSPSTLATRLNGNCGTQSLALADGLRDGQIKTLMSPKGVCTTNTTITPAHFGDGTTLTWSSTTLSSPVWATLAWDAADGTWRTIDLSSNVTVNP